jgi:hypothetical protein
VLAVTLLAAAPAKATIFLVTNTNDSGSGSLRQAILDANAAMGADDIHFDIEPGTGEVHTITPLTPLPQICCDVAAVTIDGSTQPGYAGTPLIELDGSTAGGDGLSLQDGPSIVRGLAINRFATGVRLGNRGGAGHTLEDCFIGTDPTGTLDRGNTTVGVAVSSGSFEGPPFGQTIKNNLISGNAIGIEFGFTPAIPFLIGETLIQGNLIGTAIDGITPLPNDGNGIRVLSGGLNTIGGDGVGEGNVIAFNGGAGVRVDSFGPNAGNEILRNSIHSNGQLGIDLGAAGVTANDAMDADTGPNNLQNFPVLTAASFASGMTTVEGSLHSVPSTQFRIDFYVGGDCDGTGNGEGRTWIGTIGPVATNAMGDGTFGPNAFATPSPGARATATATHPDGSTSEFSACIPVTGFLDVDDDGETMALTDALLILRYLFGVRDGALVGGAVDLGDCARCEADAIEAYIELLRAVLDVDQNGQANALTDALLLLRYLFGLRDGALVAGAVDLDDCGRCDAAAIEPYIGGMIPAP